MVSTPSRKPATAVVMNLFYSGLGIARSLGAKGIPVVGLTAQRGIYGNFTRYAKTLFCADSRNDPGTLLEQLVVLGKSLDQRAVLFPTRDHDLVFLDRFRSELAPYFSPVIPSAESLERCLNKWETYCDAVAAGVPTPRSWLIQQDEDLQRALSEITYPCVLKPLAAHHWRTAGNWDLVGARKAIGLSSREELMTEYAAVARADRRMLVQECIPGGDDCLIVAACYVDREHTFQAGFNAQKLVQIPAGFGTGCIVQSIRRPELFERTARLLQSMEFTGIAEVEYKWDATDAEYKLIEVNPRPWDQHTIGAASGVDLIHLAYCDHAGLPKPAIENTFEQRKWIAEDAFLMGALRLLWRREPGLRELFRQARGKKVYAIWQASDPLPFLAYLAGLVPTLIRMGLQTLRPTPVAASGSSDKATARAIP
jgi:predicted ATP-grasp superfamily ATP-dependent carboligase